MALTRAMLMALLLLGTSAWAEELVPPAVREMPPIAFPEDAPVETGVVTVKVHLTIGVDGRVKHAEIVEGAGEPYDGAVLEGVKRFEFEPARLQGQPAEVVLPFTHTFVRPAPPVEEGHLPQLQSRRRRRGHRTILRVEVHEGLERIALTQIGVDLSPRQEHRRLAGRWLGREAAERSRGTQALHEQRVRASD